MKYLLLLILFFTTSTTNANANDNNKIKPSAAEATSFIPPFNFSILLSGNFGELRTNHFHGGLDFKTNGRINQPIAALADGYIDRARVTNSSGLVLDVVYHNRYLTINRHLNRFLPKIEKKIKNLQYEKQKWCVELNFKPNEIPLKQGDIIGYSGNTGYSFGPHLHLDLIDLESANYIDPLLFFKDKIKDDIAPRASSILFAPLFNKGVVEGESQPLTIPINQLKNVTAWGVVGLGIKGYDYMNNTHNHYGIYSVALLVDENKIFESKLNHFKYSDHRYINSWVYNKHMKSYIEPNNKLDFIEALNENNGLITIDEERPYHCRYIIKDRFGNKRDYRFTITGKPQEVIHHDIEEKYYFKWDENNYLEEIGVNLLVPKEELFKDCYLDFEIKSLSKRTVSNIYQLNNREIPLLHHGYLAIGIKDKMAKDTIQYHIVKYLNNGKHISIGGEYSNGFIKSKISTLGTYAVEVDSIAPKIIAINKAKWKSRSKVIFKMEDEESGIAHYKAFIDGEFALLKRPNITRPYWHCDLEPQRFKKGKKHEIEVVVTDHCGNESKYSNTFYW